VSFAAEDAGLQPPDDLLGLEHNDDDDGEEYQVKGGHFGLF
jgi:hypothetical protein